jgi:hypothetical protein
MKPAPPFYLTAIGAARIVGGPPGPPTPLLLIFHDHAGAETAFSINATLRAHFPAIEQLQIASVVGLHHVPRYMRTSVEQTVNAAYRQAAATIPPSLDPTDYVLIVPDWEGKVFAAYGMDECREHVGVALIVKPWRIFDTYQGEDPLNAVLQMVIAALGNDHDK